MEAKTRIKEHFRSSFYQASALLLWLLFKFFNHFQARLQEKIKLKRPLIIVANHQSFLDPPLVGVALAICLKIYPVYFMTKASLMEKPFLGILMRALSCFPVGVSFKKPIQIIGQGGTVGIFPQGTRRKSFNLTQGQPGAAALALKTKCPLLPVTVYDSAPGKIRNFLLRKRRIRVLIGRPFSLQEKLGHKNQYGRHDFEEGAKIIMAEIEKLLKLNSK